MAQFSQSDLRVLESFHHPRDYICGNTIIEMEQSIFNNIPDQSLNRSTFHQAILKLNLFDSIEIDLIFDQIKNKNDLITTSNFNHLLNSFKEEHPGSSIATNTNNNNDNCNNNFNCNNNNNNNSNNDNNSDVNDVSGFGLGLLHTLQDKLNQEQDKEDQIVLELEQVKTEKHHLHEQLLSSKQNYRALAIESDTHIQQLINDLKISKSQNVVQKKSTSMDQNQNDEVVRLRVQVFDLESAWEEEREARKLLTIEITEERIRHQQMKKRLLIKNQKEMHTTTTSTRFTTSQVFVDTSTQTTSTINPIVHNKYKTVSEMYGALENLKAQLISARRRYKTLQQTTNEKLVVENKKNNKLELRLRQIQHLVVQLPQLINVAEQSGNDLSERINYEQTIRRNNDRVVREVQVE